MKCIIQNIDFFTRSRVLVSLSFILLWFLRVLIIFLLLISYSCERETDWLIKPSDSVLVVDAIITNENSTQEIRVNYSYNNLNETPVSVSGLKIYIKDKNSIYNFVESETTKGLYISNPLIIAGNINYTLVIEHNGKIDSANTYKAVISPFKEYIFKQKDELWKYIDGGSDLPAMTEVYYNWTDNQEYCNKYGSCKASEVYYALSIVDVGKEFAPPKQEILFPIGTIITRKKYSLSTEHQKFIRSLLIETEWRGGLFDTEHGNIPTNFTQGTRGWFAVCQVLTDSIEVGK